MERPDEDLRRIQRALPLLTSVVTATGLFLLAVGVVGPMGLAAVAALSVAVVGLTHLLLHKRLSFGREVEAALALDQATEAGVTAVSEWWVDPPPLTDNEAAVLRHFANIMAVATATTEDTEGEEAGEPNWAAADGPWSMVGGKAGSDGTQQLGFTSIRYHAAFLAYAVHLACSRTPAFQGTSRPLLLAAMKILLSRKTWGYVGHWWGDEALDDPWSCDENVMWSGHVLHVAVAFEALTGDGRFSRAGGLRVVNARGVARCTDTHALARRLSELCRASPSGGVACEPGCVFAPCQGHPQVAFRLLEGMGAGLSFAVERHRWERHIVSGLRAVVPSGALRVFESDRLGGAAVPFGHPGNDGWTFTYFAAFTSSPRAVKLLWHSAVARALRVGRWLSSLRTREGKGGDGGVGKAPFDTCCGSLVSVPASSWAAALLPAAIQCGDDVVAAQLQGFLERHHVTRTVDAAGEDTLCLGGGVEWSTGSTANYLMALCLRAAGASALRDTVLRPLPRGYFRGPLVTRAEPQEACVLGAWLRGSRELVLRVRPPRGRASVCLMLVNTLGVEAVEEESRGGPDQTRVVQSWNVEKEEVDGGSNGARAVRLWLQLVDLASLCVRCTPSD